MVREFLTADVEGIERVGAVGAVFEQIFFGLCNFSPDLSLRKPLRPLETPPDCTAQRRGRRGGIRSYLVFWVEKSLVIPYRSAKKKR